MYVHDAVLREVRRIGDTGQQIEVLLYTAAVIARTEGHNNGDLLERKWKEAQEHAARNIPLEPSPK